MFEVEPVSAALERGLASAEHLDDRHAPAVAAARALARKIDAWDVIVGWALDDAADSKGGRPAVPANDNVSIASFLKYLDALGLTPPVSGVRGSSKPDESTPANKVLAFRQKAQAG